MEKLNAFYFSGTGNTKYIAQKLCEKLSGSYETKIYDISANKNFFTPLERADKILIAFPIYGSSPPMPMREFVHKYSRCFKDKHVIIVATQYMFSGDGSASLGRTIEKFGGRVDFAEHFNMPNNLSDFKLFSIKNGEELNKRLNKVEKHINSFVKRIESGKPFRRGFNPISHAVGYYCQRKFWRKGEDKKKNALKIDTEKCVGCGLCVRNCPVKNLTLTKGKASSMGNCAFCYRCINKCPKKAITLFGKNAPKTQYNGIPEKAVKNKTI